MRFTRRMLCLLLAMMLVFSVPLGAMAEAPPEEKEVLEVSETVEATEAVVETTAPEETEEVTEPSTEEPAEDPTEETVPPAEDTTDESEDDRLLGAEAYASTQKSIMLFDFADNGDYTTRLNYQVTCAYKPNGSGTTRTAYVKNMGWHFARYGGVAHADEPLYCIEPYQTFHRDHFLATKYLQPHNQGSLAYKNREPCAYRYFHRRSSQKYIGLHWQLRCLMRPTPNRIFFSEDSPGLYP